MPKSTNIYNGTWVTQYMWPLNLHAISVVNPVVDNKCTVYLPALWCKSSYSPKVSSSAFLCMYDKSTSGHKTDSKHLIVQ